MKRLKIIILLFFFVNFNSTIIKNLPTVAILANPEPYNAIDAIESTVSYKVVRWLDQILFRSIVIQPWYTKNEINDILNLSDAVVFLGGDRNITIGGQFETVATNIINKIIDLKDNEEKSLPLFAICQGFQILHILIANSTDVLSNFNSRGIESPLEFNPESINSNLMYKDFSKNDVNILETENVLAQFHYFGISKEEYNKYPKLNEFFRITAFGKDLDGKEYINSVEAYNYPIFGVQFHPELISYTNYDYKGVPDTLEAAELAMKFGLFFAKQARINMIKGKKNKIRKYDLINTFEMLPEKKKNFYYYRFSRRQQRKKYLFK